MIGLYKTEVIRRQGPWRDLETVEFATLEWVDWFNHRRLLGPIGHVSPAEFEQQYYLVQEAPVIAAGLMNRPRCLSWFYRYSQVRSFTLF